MNGNKALPDSNILIYASRREIDIEALLNAYNSFSVSIITYMEVYGYNFQDDTERKLVDELFQVLEIIDINRPIADFTVRYKKNKTRKIRLPDAVILSTCQMDRC